MPKNVNVTAPTPLGPIRVPVNGDAMDASADIEGLTQQILNMIAGGLQTATPVGITLPYGGRTAPAGWLLCNGAELSRTTYAALFAVIGSDFGSASINTFTLPDLRGRMAIGAGQALGLTNRVLGQPGGEELHALTIQELPAHSHQAPTALGSTAGSFEVPPVNTTAGFGSYDYINAAPTDVTGGNAGHNTMSPFLVMNYIIRS